MTIHAFFSLNHESGVLTRLSRLGQRQKGFGLFLLCGRVGALCREVRRNRGHRDRLLGEGGEARDRECRTERTVREVPHR